MTGRQGMLTPPRHLIPPVVCSETRVSPFIYLTSKPTCISRLITLRYLRHFIRKLSCKYYLFWLCGSGEEDFSMTPPHFCIFLNYLPFEEDLALYLNNLESPLPKDDIYYV